MKIFDHTFQTLVEFIEYLFYKVNDAINSLDGGQHKGYHRLSRFQHKLKDKFVRIDNLWQISVTNFRVCL